MSMLDWAKKEVEIACKKENPDREEGEWDYGCACYESALKAFNSLLEDGHSGFSIALTKHILNRLIECKPLTPIEDTDDIWNLCCYSHNPGEKQYQCTRMHSLFKTVYPNGGVKYHNVDRVYCVDVDNEDIVYQNSFISKIVDEMYPIQMPYMPSDKPFKVYCKYYLTDPKNGDYDTIKILYLITPYGKRVDVYRYFKEDADGNGMVEIDENEMIERVLLHNTLLINLELGRKLEDV